MWHFFLYLALIFGFAHRWRGYDFLLQFFLPPYAATGNRTHGSSKRPFKRHSTSWATHPRLKVTLKVVWILWLVTAKEIPTKLGEKFYKFFSCSGHWHLSWARQVIFESSKTFMACDTLSPTFYCRFMLLVPLFGSNIEPATLAITSTTAFLLDSNFLLFIFPCRLEPILLVLLLVCWTSHQMLQSSFTLKIF